MPGGVSPVIYQSRTRQDATTEQDAADNGGDMVQRHGDTFCLRVRRESKHKKHTECFGLDLTLQKVL